MSPSQPPYPDFQSTSFLREHVLQILDFYQPTALDNHGGFFHHFMNDGSVYDPSTRHLVSSTRFVFNYALAARHLDLPYAQSWLQHGIDYLQSAHFQPNSGGYLWLLDQHADHRETLDATNHCYGLAFVMVAGATALLAGNQQGQELVKQAWQTMSAHFWDETVDLYADEANADFSVIDPYRGQNANMHACEGLIWAYHATGNNRYLERAIRIAKAICVTQASHGNGLIWEHYHEDWTPNWDYNLDNPKHLFKPWGYQPGHQTEWAKLLCQLYRIAPKAWQLERAQALFNTALYHAWDDEHGGIVYGFDREGKVCDGDKYFWVQAESFAAAYQLYELTKNQTYREWYQRIWTYSWDHMIDHQYGAWFRILSQDNQPLEATKSPAGKTDYHTMGACYEVLNLLPKS